MNNGALSLEAVIFDMDGVLCELDDQARLGYLSSLCGMSAPEVRAAIWESGFEDLSDSGELSASEYLAGFGERIGYPLTLAEWTAARRAGTKPSLASLEIVASLRGGVALGLLTNNGLLLKATMADVFPQVTELFGPHVFVSAEFGTRKPDPAIFQRACHALGTDPAKTLMIDDREENVLGARSAGLHVHHFKSVEELARHIEGLIKWP